MTSQKEIVYEAVQWLDKQRLLDDKLDFSKPIREQISNEEKQAVARYVENAFRCGTTGFSSPSHNWTEFDLHKYVVGLTNNWLRKDIRLNGGQAYTTQQRRRLQREFHRVDDALDSLESTVKAGLKAAKICQCGAKHTNFPNHHSTWCDMYKG